MTSTSPLLAPWPSRGLPMKKCCESCETCSDDSRICLNGWRSTQSKVPNPWVALAARPHLTLARLPIAEPARYYDTERAIVMRKGLLIVEERRHLWHELVHSDRRDTAGHNSQSIERAVERRAVRLAIPTASLQWAAYRTDTMCDLADLLKLPEDWVRFRWTSAPAWEREMIRRSDPVYGAD